MPVNIRKLAPEEAQRFFPRGGLRLPQQEYIDALRGMKPGDVAEAVRGNLTGRAFKRRLTLAAKHLGLALRYAKEAGDEAVRFQVREPGKSRKALPAAGGSTAGRRAGGAGRTAGTAGTASTAANGRASTGGGMSGGGMSGGMSGGGAATAAPKRRGRPPKSATL